MRKCFLLLFGLLLAMYVSAQYIAVDHEKSGNQFFTSNGFASPGQNKKPEIMKNGFIDFLDNGSIQASARLLRLNIGEPGKFYIPLIIYTGVAGQAFGNSTENKTTVSNLLNPAGGIANFSFSKNHNLLKGANLTYTKLQLSYQLGVRLVNGTDTVSKKNTGFFNGFGNAGLYFQTGAWEDGSNSIGLFWIQAKASASLSSQSTLENFFGDLENKYLYGYTFDAGLEVNGVVNFKLSVYRYLNNKDIALLTKPVVKFSLDYSFGK